MISELKLIQKIKKWIPRSLQAELPIGDDAAVLRSPKGKRFVYTADSIVEGIDFLRSGRKPGVLSAQQVGRKVLAINLSDLAAMGAQPFACTLSLGIPKKYEESWIKNFYRGMIALAKEYKVKIAGGDLSQSQTFFASVALIGIADPGSIVTRAGAKPGHWIGVTGALGGSLLKKHALFTPRVKEAAFLARFNPSSMMDVSDGLLQDLSHILSASHCGARLEVGEIPISGDAVALAKQKPLQAFERACSDGEDFELLFTLPDSARPSLLSAWKKKFPKVPLSWIGRIEKGRKIRWVQNGQEVRLPKFKKSGYTHFQ